MNSELEDMLKENQRLLADTLRATNRLNQVATAIVENHDERLERLARLAEHEHGHLDRVEDVLEKVGGRLDLLGAWPEDSTRRHSDRMDRLENALDRLEALVDRFVRGPRGNGRTPRRGGQK